MEVQRFPGIGFSSCAVPTFDRIQGILNGGYKLSFWNVLDWREHTGTTSSMSMKVREMEVQSRRAWRDVECTRIDTAYLICRKSRVEQDKHESSSSLLFRMQKHT